MLENGKLYYKSEVNKEFSDESHVDLEDKTGELLPYMPHSWAETLFFNWGIK